MQLRRKLIWVALSILLAGFPVLAKVKTSGSGREQNLVYAINATSYDGTSAALRFVDHDRGRERREHRDWHFYRGRDRDNYYGGYYPYYSYSPYPYGYGYPRDYYYPYSYPYANRYKYRFYSHVFDDLFHAFHHH